MATNPRNISLDFLRRQLDRVQESLNTNEEVLFDHSGDGGPPMSNADERMGRLEAAIEGLRHSQNLLVAAVFGVGAILAALGIYSLQRIDTLADRVNALPTEISSEIRDITKTLADVIIATKQAQPSPPIPVAPPPKN